MPMLQACTAKMNLSEEVDLEDYVGRPDKISNAEISAICQEAGMHAVRKNRYALVCVYLSEGPILAVHAEQLTHIHGSCFHQHSPVHLLSGLDSMRTMSPHFFPIH